MAKVVNVLSPAQRTKLLQIPDDFTLRKIVRNYALSPEDLDVIAEHRRPHNRLGFTVQLAYFGMVTKRGAAPTRPGWVE